MYVAGAVRRGRMQQESLNTAHEFHLQWLEADMYHFTLTPSSTALADDGLLAAETTDSDKVMHPNYR